MRGRGSVRSDDAGFQSAKPSQLENHLRPLQPRGSVSTGAGKCGFVTAVSRNRGAAHHDSSDIFCGQNRSEAPDNGAELSDGRQPEQRVQTTFDCLAPANVASLRQLVSTFTHLPGHPPMARSSGLQVRSRSGKKPVGSCRNEALFSRTIQGAEAKNCRR